MKNKTFYYNLETDDVIVNKNQEYKISEKYKYIHTNPIYNFFSKIIYKLGVAFGHIYCKNYLSMQIENIEKLEQLKDKPYIIYANHTQELADVFWIPTIIKGKRVYVIGSQSNLGVQIIGKILPMLGILPTGQNITQTKQLYFAVKQRLEQNNVIVIYPEAHLWPYYTKIREFEKTSFEFAVKFDVPVFSFTTTYQKENEKQKKPKIVTYIDRPFFVDKTLPKNKQKEEIHDKVYNSMKERSKMSNFEYIKYVKKQEEGENT